jgi:hypothetical protein
MDSEWIDRWIVNGWMDVPKTSRGKTQMTRKTQTQMTQMTQTDTDTDDTDKHGFDEDQAHRRPITC